MRIVSLQQKRSSLRKCHGCGLFSAKERKKERQEKIEKRATQSGSGSLCLMAFCTHKGQHSVACRLMGAGRVTVCWSWGRQAYKGADCLQAVGGDSISEPPWKRLRWLTQPCANLAPPFKPTGRGALRAAISPSALASSIALNKGHFTPPKSSIITSALNVKWQSLELIQRPPNCQSLEAKLPVVNGPAQV